MAIKEIDNILDDESRNIINNNFSALNASQSKIVQDIKAKTYAEIVDAAKLNWKEPVDSISDLPLDADASEGETRMTRDTGIVWRFNGSEWREIQQIDVSPLNEIDSRLSEQMAHVVQQKADKTEVNELASGKVDKYDFNDFRSATGASLGAITQRLDRPLETPEIIEQLFTSYVGGTLSNSNGNLNPSDTLVASDVFIPVDIDSPYVYGFQNYSNGSNEFVKVARYDENQQFISMHDFVTIPPNSFNELPLVEGTSFIKVALSKFAADYFFINIGERPYYELPPGSVYDRGFWDSIPTPPLRKKTVNPNHLSDDTSGLVNAWRELLEVEYIENLTKNYVVGAISRTSGNIVSSEDGIRTTENFIPIKSDEPYTYGAGSFSEGWEIRYVRFAYYDKDKNFISATAYIDLPRHSHSPVPIVDNTAFMRISISRQATDSFFMNIGNEPYEPGSRKVYRSGASELLPAGVIEPKHLSERFEFVGSTIMKKQKPFPSKFRFETLSTGPEKISHLSRDGKVLYASRVTQAMQSLDEGKTWQSIAGPSPNGQPVFAIRELDDGELLITTVRDHNQGIKAKIYKTRGYNRHNLSGVTMEEVLEAKGTYADFNDWWCLEAHDNIVVANEYGRQGMDGARHAFLSTDYGETWTEIFDQYESRSDIEGAPSYTSDAHLHTIHYDRYWDRIWLAVGDRDNTAVYYSDDHGDSWKIVKGSVGLEAIQYTGIVSYPEGVFFGSDREPDGIYVWYRTENKSDDAYIEMFHPTKRREGVRTLVYARPFRRYAEKDEVTFFTGERDIAVAGEMGAVIVGFKGIHGAATLFDDFTEEYPHLVEITSCVGVTAGGNVLVSVKDSNTNSYVVMRAKAPVWE